jgi:hypothetical protein
MEVAIQSFYTPHVIGPPGKEHRRTDLLVPGTPGLWMQRRRENIHWNTFRLIHRSFIVLRFCDAVRAVQQSTNNIQERVSHSTALSAPVWRPRARPRQTQLRSTHSSVQSVQSPPAFRVRWGDVLALSNNSDRAPRSDEQFKISREHGNEISGLKRTEKSVIWWLRDCVHLVRRPLFCLLHQPRMTNNGDCGAIGGMRTGRGNRSTRRKSGPVPICPPQIKHDLTRALTQAASVVSRQLTAWAMARPVRSDEVLSAYDNLFCSLLLMNESRFGREILTLWFRCETMSNFYITRLWILAQWKCSLPLTRRRATDFHPKFCRNAASGHISIPICTHINACFLVCPPNSIKLPMFQMM